jgi:hypothetical protein
MTTRNEETTRQKRATGCSYRHQGEWKKHRERNNFSSRPFTICLHHPSPPPTPLLISPPCSKGGPCVPAASLTEGGADPLHDPDKQTNDNHHGGATKNDLKSIQTVQRGSTASCSTHPSIVAPSSCQHDPQYESSH